jgi:hypothetical protein
MFIHERLGFEAFKTLNGPFRRHETREVEIT